MSRRDRRTHPTEGLVRTYLAGVVAVYAATQSVWAVAIASAAVGETVCAARRSRSW